MVELNQAFVPDIFSVKIARDLDNGNTKTIDMRLLYAVFNTITQMLWVISTKYAYCDTLCQLSD